MVSLRVVDALYTRVEAETGGRVTELLHAVIEMLSVMFVLRILVTRVLSGTVHPVTQPMEQHVSTSYSRSRVNIPRSG